MLSSRMELVIALPLCDVRDLVGRPTGRLPRPAFPLTQPGIDFIRSAGRVALRRPGLGVHGSANQHWSGEDIFCHTKNGIRFEGSLRAAYFGSGSVTFDAWKGSRGFLYDGVATARHEIGLVEKDLGYMPLEPHEVVEAVAAVMAYPIKVPTGKRQWWTGPLVASGPQVARHLLSATTRRTGTSTTPEAWWLTPGDLVAVVQYQAIDDVDAWPGMQKFTHSHGGIELSCTSLFVDNRRITVWFLGSSDSTVANAEEVSAHLIRLHCIRHSLRTVLRMIREVRIPKTRGSDRLQQFLLGAAQYLARSRSGIDQSEALSAAYAADDIISAQERANLVASLHEIRPNVARLLDRALSLDAAARPASASAAIATSQKGRPILVYGGTVLMGDDNSIKLDHSTATNSNLGRNINVSNSYNQVVEQSQLDDDVKKLLIDLRSRAEATQQELAPDEANALVEDVEKFAGEVIGRKRAGLLVEWSKVIKEGALVAVRLGPALVASLNELLSKLHIQT
jgi:hypothetical protein